MSDNKFRFNYDKEYDVLFIYHSAKKSKGSIEFGEDIHISFDRYLDIVALEIVNASKILSKISKIRIKKNDLENLKSGGLDTTKTKSGLVHLKFYLYFANGIKPIEEGLILQDIKHKSPVTSLARS